MTTLCLSISKFSIHLLRFTVPATLDRFEITPRYANETGNVSIQCTASGNPTPVVTIVSPNGMNVSQKMGRAVLNNVNRTQAGFYTCRVTNGLNAPINPRIELVVSCMYSISFSFCSLRATCNSCFFKCLLHTSQSLSSKCVVSICYVIFRYIRY